MIYLKVFSKCCPRSFARTSCFRNFSIRFAPSHEYVRMEGDIGTIGITPHAADALGDIVFVDLPAVGTEFKTGDSFGSIESVKAASDVYIPIGGEVVEINNLLERTPGAVNDSALDLGWFMKIKVNGAGKDDFAKLLDEPTYETHVENENSL